MVTADPESEVDDDDDDPTYADWDECQSCHEFTRLVSVTDVPEGHDGEYCEKCAAALRKTDTELKF